MADTPDDRDDLDNDDIDNGSDDNTPEPGAEDLRAELEKAREALQNANKESARRRQQLNRLKEVGLDVDSAIALAEEQKKQKEKANLRQGDVEKVKKQLEETYNAQIETERVRAKKLEETLRTTLVTERISQELNAADAIPGSLKVLVPYISNLVKVVEEDGRYVPRVVDAEGTYEFDKNGDYMSVKSLVESLKTDEAFAPFFRVRDGGGSGTNAGRRGVNKVVVTKKSELTSNQDRVEYMRKYGVSKRVVDDVPCYNELP